MFFDEKMQEIERSLAEYGQKRYMAKFSNINDSLKKVICNESMESLRRFIISEYVSNNDFILNFGMMYCDDFFNILNDDFRCSDEVAEQLSAILIYLSQCSNGELDGKIFSEISDLFHRMRDTKVIILLKDAISFFFFKDLFIMRNVSKAFRWIEMLKAVQCFHGVCHIYNGYFELDKLLVPFFNAANNIKGYRGISLNEFGPYEGEVYRLEAYMEKLSKGYKDFEDDEFFLNSYFALLLYEGICSLQICQETILSHDITRSQKDHFKDFLKRNAFFLPNCVNSMFSEMKYSDFLKYAKRVIEVYSLSLFVKSKLKNTVCKELSYYTSFETFNYLLPHKTEGSALNSVFTEINSLKSNNKSDCAKWSFMNVDYMNDPNEGNAIYKYLGIAVDNSETYLGRKRLFPSDVYLKSFSDRRDDLSMWEIYGNHAEGVNVVIDWKATQEKGKTPSVFNILYVSLKDSQEHDNDSLNSLIDRDTMEKIENTFVEIKSLYSKSSDRVKVYLEQAISPLRYLVKDSSYWHEKESRIIFDERINEDKLKYTGGDIPKIFYQGQFTLSIKEVILGPKCKDAAEKALYLYKQFLEMNQAFDVQIPKLTISSIEYR